MRPQRRKSQRIIAEYTHDTRLFCVRREGARDIQAVGLTMRHALTNLEELEYRLKIQRRINVLSWLGLAAIAAVGIVMVVGGI